MGEAERRRTVASLREDPILARRILEERYREVRELLHIGEEGAGAVDLDQARIGRLSRMDAIQQQAMAQDAERRRRQELHRIEAALKRLEVDDYGYCLACGEPIAAARLELDPAATHCVDCASRQ
jgi:DnaK suppressor protein